MGTLTNGDTDRVTEKGVKFLVRPAASSVSGIAPAPGTVAPSVAGCEILDLVLGPLDLILARPAGPPGPGAPQHHGRPGAGELLGNLLCAVAGLLDST